MSESRQEMVSQLLSDVLEAAEARSGPLAVGKSPDKSASGGASGKEVVNYDRFGFRIDGDASADGGDGKMLSRLWREAEEHLDAANDNLSESGAGVGGGVGGGDASSIEERWNEAIAALVKAKVPFAITSDVKDMLRLGIPISQRVNLLIKLKCCVGRTV